MSEFSRNSNGGGNGRSLSPSGSFRRRSSANPEPESPSRFNYPSSPQQSRRQSTVFRTRSPSDPQNNYNENPQRLSRRYSQPASYQGVYADHPSPSLVRQERKTYSSLNHLPEVRTYLQFMEDSTVLPQRSKSFNGRNSSRRSSYNRRRPRSRPRTPILVGDESDPILHRVGSGSSSHYGVYLTPRAASLEQSSSNHLDYDQGNDADVEDIDGEPSKKGQSTGQLGQYNSMVVDRMSAATATLYNDCFSQRRSSIRTTFI